MAVITSHSIQNPRPLIAAIAIAAGACLSDVARADVADVEPNETIANAVDTGLNSNGTVVITGASLAEYLCYDVDVFGFSIPDADTSSPSFVHIAVQATDPNLDAYLRLFRADGTELIANDDAAYPVADPIIDTVILAPGTYYVGVSYSGIGYYSITAGTGLRTFCVPDEGFYDLTISTSDYPAIDSSSEPNDDVDSAIAIALSASVGGFIGDGPNGRADSDVYVIDVDDPVILHVQVAATPGSPLDPTVSIDRIGNNDDASLDTNDAELTVAIFDAGEYFIAVRGAGNVPHESAADFTAPTLGSVGSYQLTVNATSIIDLGGVNEPDDSIPLATFTGLVGGSGLETFQGYIGDGQMATTRGDVDFYYFLLNPEDELTIDVDASVLGSPLDSRVVVFDYYGSKVASNDNDASTTDSFLNIRYEDIGPQSFGFGFVMILGAGQRQPRNPLAPDSGGFTDPSVHVVESQLGSTGPYYVTFEINSESRSAPSTSATGTWGLPIEPKPATASSGTGGGARMFAIATDAIESEIVQLDSIDGSTMGVIAAPEPLVSLGNGLAVGGDALYMLGSGRYPILHRIDLLTQQSQSVTALWPGSGYYGDIAILGDQLYFTDILDQSIHVLDLNSVSMVKSLNVAGIDGRMSGPIAALSNPDRIVVSDHATADAGVHIVNPMSGAVSSMFDAAESCACNGDFDHDGDVDDEDGFTQFSCRNLSSIAGIFYDCHQSDLDCDGDIDADDQSILDCQNAGPGMPPNEGCCVGTIGVAQLKITALAGWSPSRILAHDSERTTIQSLSSDGQRIETRDFNGPWASIATDLAVPGDANADGAIDNADYALLAECLEAASGPLDLTCVLLDLDYDEDLDLADYAAFQRLIDLGP